MEVKLYRCSRCGEHLPSSSFNKVKANKSRDGCHYTCKSCHQSENKRRAYAKGRRPLPKTDEERFRRKCQIDAETECWLWTGYVSQSGYGEFTCIGKPGIRERANRVSYRMFKGPLEEGYFVCHMCHNPLCVNPDHLYLGTPKDNVLDKHKDGTWGSKLTKDQVHAIISDTRSTGKIAKEYNISNSHVRAIKQGRVWKHVDLK